MHFWCLALKMPKFNLFTHTQKKHQSCNLQDILVFSMNDISVGKDKKEELGFDVEKD